MSGAALALLLLLGVGALAAGCIFLVAVIGGVGGSATTSGGSSPGSKECRYLEQIPGLHTRGWKHRYEDDWGCSSDYKSLGFGEPQNDLAYHVEGIEGAARTARLVLNVHNRAEATAAQRELASAANLLVKAVTGAAITYDLQNAILTAAPASGVIGGRRMTVSRENWPTGKGYSVRFVVEL